MVTGWRRLLNPYNIFNALAALSASRLFPSSTTSYNRFPFPLFPLPTYRFSVYPTVSRVHPRRAFAPGNTFPCIFLGGFACPFARLCLGSWFSVSLARVYDSTLPSAFPRALITNFSAFLRNSRSHHYLLRPDGGFFRRLPSLYSLSFPSGLALTLAASR